MRGFWADERIEGGIWNQKNPFYKWAYHYFKRMELIFLKESDVVVSLTEKARKELLSWKGIMIDSNKIRVIPCCVDPDVFSEENIHPLIQASLRQELGIVDESFVLSYAGSIGTWYLLDEMLIFYTCLLRRQLNAIFLIITPDDPKTIYASARRLQIAQEKIIVRYASRDEMPALLSLSDASIFFIKNTWSKRASSPTKMGELMSMGIPIVCNTGVGDTDEMIIKSKSGILVDKLDIQHYDEAVERLLSTHFSKEQIKAAASAFFSLKNGVNSYREIYDSLIT